MTRGRGGSPSTCQTGARAEAAGQRFLEQRGLRLLTRNYRCRYGELDLVMMDDGELVMVEVRYRADPSLLDPALTVTRTKQARLLRSALRFLQERPDLAGLALRFDVLSVTGSLGSPRFGWFRGAFTGEDAGR